MHAMHELHIAMFDWALAHYVGMLRLGMRLKQIAMERAPALEPVQESASVERPPRQMLRAIAGQRRDRIHAGPPPGFGRL